MFAHSLTLWNRIVFSQEKENETKVATILLRASTSNILSDVERAIGESPSLFVCFASQSMPTDDSINIVRQTARDRRFLPGGGAVELELARQLHQFAEKRAGLEQYAINAFGDALQVIPRTLAENAGLNGMTNCTPTTRKATSRTEWTLRMVALQT